jgi:hypothetical protein
MALWVTFSIAVTVHLLSSDGGFSGCSATNATSGGRSSTSTGHEPFAVEHGGYDAPGEQSNASGGGEPDRVTAQIPSAV